MTHFHDMPFGAALLPGGGVRFRVWAPSAAHVDLKLENGPSARVERMAAVADGWHELTDAAAAAGTRYRYVMPDGAAVPDPASRWNPEGVHGPSVVVDARAHAWRDEAWTGRPWHETVAYELHVGTFTPEGTYRAAMARLPDLRELGVTAVELLPLAEFPGERGWGYDGVLPYAPHAAYGTPDDLKAFVETAHALELMVLIDVVYNHFGPEGNYLHGWCPEFFNPAHATPWGAAINFDGPRNRPVRDYFLHNALAWVEEYRFDGLRMDAIHAIRDDSPVHICSEIGEALRELGRRSVPPRAIHLVLENEANLARLLERDENGVPVVADAQWNDDLHHAAHVLATGETDGYYADYADQPIARFGRTLAEGFAYQGEASALREGDTRGEPSGHLPSVAFVSFLQNHDQIGNRAFGDRIAALAAATGAAGPARLAALHACLLLSPHVPMLFMGEEFAASAPFLFFCDFGPELAAAVSTGRRAEFKRFAAFADEAARERIPDPNARTTFEACKLDWAERGQDEHADVLAAITHLLALRAEHLVPRLAHPTLGGSATVDGEVLRVDWVLGDGSLWHLAANFGARPADVAPMGRVVLALRTEGQRLEPDGVRVSIEATEAPLAQATVAAEAPLELDAERPLADAVSPDLRPASAADPEPA